MKILLVHNFYQGFGGENVVALSEKRLLEKYGHTVELYSVSNDIISGFYTKIQCFLNVVYSQTAKASFSKAIDRFSPDIVHVHNFFPLLTPSIFDSCIEKNIPVILTLHNYRTICPGAMFLRKGAVCETCVKGSVLDGVFHKCYRNSLFGSLAVARMVAYHRRNGTWENKINRFIALTDFSKGKFLEAGFPADKIMVKPNFVFQAPRVARTSADQFALFVGRLSPEKGLKTLLDAWRGLSFPLRVVGDGPMLDALDKNENQQVCFAGRKSAEEVAAAMSQAAFLVMPSEWYEGLPMVLVEAYSLGLPVIGSRLGSLAELIMEGTTGLLFEPGDVADLRKKLDWAWNHPEEMRQMGARAREVYEQNYTPSRNYERLISIYQDALRDAQNRSSNHQHSS